MLGLVAILLIKRKDMTAEEAVDDAVRPIATAERTVLRDDYAGTAFVVLVALFAFVVWTVLKGNKLGNEDDRQPGHGVPSTAPPVSASGRHGAVAR